VEQQVQNAAANEDENEEQQVQMRGRMRSSRRNHSLVLKQKGNFLPCAVVERFFDIDDIHVNKLGTVPSVYHQFQENQATSTKVEKNFQKIQKLSWSFSEYENKGLFIFGK
jgi:hypothetical protein